ncbi:MAG: hypothetical protein WC828_00755, partial [Thermoleophilia bacterium]
ESPFGFHPARVSRRGYPDSGYKDAQNIGVGWAREGVYAFWFLVQPDLNSPDYDFSVYDKQWGSVPASMRILANISPQGPVDEGRFLKGSYKPVDEAKYLAFVRATIERYDGDGVNDMPGLKNPIKYWQVSNEPNNSKTRDFATLQKITYTAIKDTCPDCTVLIGGATGQPSGYIGFFDKDYAPILKELGGKYVDVFDFHWYGTATGEYRLRDTEAGTAGASPGGADTLEHIRQTLKADGFPADMPIWITEMGSYSGDPTETTGPAARQIKKLEFPNQSERQQAQDDFKRFIYPLSRGVNKIFLAFGLMEGFKHEGGYFDHTGLIYDGEGANDPGRGIKKLSFFTYRKMSEKLTGADFSTIKTLRDGTGSDHLYLFQVQKDGKDTYIAWWDYFDEAGYKPGISKTIELSDLDGTMATVTSVVPTSDSGKDVKDYGTAFKSDSKPIEDGNVSVTLDEDPVIIETG